MFCRNETHDNMIRRKLRFITILVVIGFSMLILRLGYMQIVRREYYTKLSEGNRIRPIRLIPPRGVLYDRYGKKPLADNETAFDICVAPDRAYLLKNLDAKRLEMLKRMQVTPDEIIKKAKSSSGAAFEPVVIKKDIDKYTAAYLAENNSHMPEIIIKARPKRHYSGLAAHVIGYIAPVTRRDTRRGYELNDVIGKAGIEAEYEDHLKGLLGWKMVETNAYGQTVRDLSPALDAEPGQSLNLTIDSRLQEKAEELLDGKKGAIIALDPRNGEVLAIVSKPDFNPGIFSGGCSKQDWDRLIRSKDKPLLNRAIMGEYPPGSTFKIITATAALNSGKIDENTRYYCNGSFRLGKSRFRCHEHRGHGWVSIHRAIVESCNVFFYNVAYHNGVDVPLMHRYAEMFGLGKKTGIDIPGERAGFIPKKTRYPGDKINMCIGQGQVLVTPLQMANVISVMANRGVSYKPHVVLPPAGTRPELLVDLRGKVSQRTIEIVRNALKGVVERGYSRQANLPDHHTAGKTGTAQNPHGKEHAWFIGFAPFENPEIAVVVLIENVGLGSKNAAPIAGKLFAAYFNKSEAEKPLLAGR